MSACHNDPEKSSITKVSKHAPSRYSLFTCSSFNTVENKVDYYRGENCKHVTRIIDYEKK